MEIFDISRALSDEIAPWPGDTPFHFELKWKMTEGATVNVGASKMSLHNGTHADAAFHFDRSGDPIERMPLDAYVGDAVVVDLAELFSKRGDEIEKERQINQQRKAKMSSRSLISHHLFVAAVNDKNHDPSVAQPPRAVVQASDSHCREVPLELIDFGRPWPLEPGFRFGPFPRVDAS